MTHIASDMPNSPVPNAQDHSILIPCRLKLEVSFCALIAVMGADSTLAFFLVDEHPASTNATEIAKSLSFIYTPVLLKMCLLYTIFN